ncbi:MAG: hypothetical protein CMO55_25235 [Verrucomicrobiales bacterium]|nr:hypothetical protein [Verrucomicrobiales bacterium]
MGSVIDVRSVSKQYRLGQVGTGTLAHDLNRWWHKIRSREDPYLKIGESNDRASKGKSKYSWALRNISFQVDQGEVLGIIGKNGAGKSTLLKVLSRVTSPTEGSIGVKGRIASLLEVGTGFHPELSGKENIFLNGAILGMSKTEITSKFDEIVDFSGCERYIDTPVKRYSSGMYVRLAFAVAAHLEPEILIVDEVLAVGDAEFQNKCLGKMQSVAGSGRTVIFVSHNMASISRLTNRCLLMQHGELNFDGPTSTAIESYLKSSRERSRNLTDISEVPRPPGCNHAASFLQIGFESEVTIFRIGQDIQLRTLIKANARVSRLRFQITVFSSDATPVGTSCSSDEFDLSQEEEFQAIVRLPTPRLAPGNYYCDVALLAGHSSEKGAVFDVVPEALHFEIESRPLGTDKVSHWNSAWGSVCFSDLIVRSQD